MFSQETHARVLLAERHSQARDAALRAHLIAARKSKRRAEDSARWIRRVLIAVR